MKKLIGYLSLALFLASIPFANWWLDNHGFREVVPGLGPVPSAVWVVGFAFIVRDLGQVLIGRWPSYVAIAIGVGLSYYLAAAPIATASGVAFFISETTDAAIFTPLANKGHWYFALGALIGSLAASVLDSSIFIRLAFHSWDGWWQFTLAKDCFVLLALPVAWGIRLVLLPRDTSATLVSTSGLSTIHLTEAADRLPADA